MRYMWIATLAAIAAAPAAAEVASKSATGFEVVSKIVVPVAPAEAYAALGRVGEWWSDAHTYSGKASNMKLALEAGGCFCETLEGGGTIEHLRVVQARPAIMLRLQGGLGPLQEEGVAGTFSWALKPVPGGTEISQTYVVGGNVRGGADRFAPIVDQVLDEQLQNLKRHLSAGKAGG